MAYIRKKYRELLQYMDDNCHLPKKWDKFVEKQSKYHNLIIKKAEKCYCTNCKHIFESKKKVNEETKCPNCKNKYLIKRSNLKYHEFKDYLALLENVKGKLVVRYFELSTTYNNYNNDYKITHSVVEFARDFYGEIVQTFINDRVSRGLGNKYIHHYEDAGIWRMFSSYYELIRSGILYPYSLKKILKDTEYKYSMIWELAKHTVYVDIPNLLYCAKNNKSFELLVKMKLYNLALKSNYFENKDLQLQFKSIKQYYPFMKKYNISYNQFEILKIINEPDINKIRYLQRFSASVLNEILNYISVDRLIKYIKQRRGKIDIYLYKDYLKFAKFLDFDLKNNRYAFPKNLKEEHDKLEKQYKVQNEQLINKSIIKRSKELDGNIYKDKKFIIFPAHSYNDLKEESKQQHHCVRSYAEDYAIGTCDIYFLRDIEKQNEALVTVEVKRNAITQSRTKYNKEPSKIQSDFLKKWEKNILRKVA